ncbi:unnamed protein product [Oppiella nova]|uniref:Transforming acidic coiled-coil-containing protein C-terminal domain-containing protein n=1 Tax=Oppiella nova TaxID=334625 RepID=A0A7R9M4P2_9ACAR|nr:unnamed protein product [Oppiella nova]CAG2170701.1 unnamed protein product [Oppiella nova]
MSPEETIADTDPDPETGLPIDDVRVIGPAVGAVLPIALIDIDIPLTSRKGHEHSHHSKSSRSNNNNNNNNNDKETDEYKSEENHTNDADIEEREYREGDREETDVIVKEEEEEEERADSANTSPSSIERTNGDRHSSGDESKEDNSLDPNSVDNQRDMDLSVNGSACEPKTVFTDDEFKMPDRFVHELEALERRTMSADINHSFNSRASVLRRFDPLVDTMDLSDLVQKTNHFSFNDKSRSELIEHNITLNATESRVRNETIDGLTSHDMSSMRHNESTTLMNFNSPVNVPNMNSRADPLTEQNDTNNGQNCDELVNELRIKELLFQEKLIEKDRQMHGLEENLNIISNNCEKYEVLLHLLHNCNEEVVEMASQVIDDLMTDKKELMDRCNEMSAERSQALEEVNNVEKNFYEVHNRYDKVRTALEESKLREMQFNEQYMELMDKLQEKEHMYELLKSKAEEKIEHANNYIESSRRECESELIAVKAQLKRSDMKINGLQLQLEQKTKENDELTKMVDELIANVEK